MIEDNETPDENDDVDGEETANPRDKFAGEPWGRQPKESAQAYEAFEVYMMLGAQRSNARTGREVKKSKQLMDRWSARWQWVKRAEMFDLEETRQFHAELHAARRDAAKRHVKQSQALQNAAMGALRKKYGENFENITPDSLKNGEILAFLIQAAKLERTALGEPGEISETQHTSGAADDDRKPTTPLTFAGRIEDALALLEAARARTTDAATGKSD